MFTSLFERALLVLFPPTCEACGAPPSQEDAMGVCPTCRAQITTLEPPFCERCGRPLRTHAQRCAECLNPKEPFGFDRAFACLAYTGPAKILLHSFKFKGRKHLKKFFAARMEQFMTRHLKDSHFDAVCAVPLDSAKRRARGFNQSELLARELSRAGGLPHGSQWLRRNPSPYAQSALNKTDRKANVQGRFWTPRPSALSGREILLVDDILTTGQTASECARSLKNSGARSVTVLACCRGVS